MELLLLALFLYAGIFMIIKRDQDTERQKNYYEAEAKKHENGK